MKTYFLLFIVLITGCNFAPEFTSFPKIDAHVHLETLDDSLVQNIVDRVVSVIDPEDV